MPRRSPRARPLRSGCPVAAALDVFGDRWTLLVVRDLVFYGKRRYREFLASPEGIATNILAERLERLAAHGLVERRPAPDHAAHDEYHPTTACLALEPALREMIRWGQRYVPGTAQRPPAELARLLERTAAAGSATVGHALPVNARRPPPRPPRAPRRRRSTGRR